MSKFQISVIGFFVICIIAGVVLFATYKNKDSSNALPPITVWGTFPESILSTLVREINNTRTTSLSINYVEKSDTSFDKDFIEALARGQGPDAILIPQNKILRHADKITPIPYTALTERDFKNTYISQAELYLISTGIMALPLTVDPLVMYWNRDLFTNAGIATYPKYWDEFENIAQRIDLKDVNSNIRRSAIALGEFNNINHAREILGALFIQSGNSVTYFGDTRVESALAETSRSGIQTSGSALSFFTQFSNPRHPEYSWNRSLPSSKSWFLSGSLATYFGFSSELFEIRAKNTNIDFDVAPFPQPRNGKNRATYGAMYGFSIVHTSPNPSAVYSVINALTSASALAILNKISYLPPVRRDMIATGSADPYQTIFYDSALISKGWLDMSVAQTNRIFQTMVESVTSGRADIDNALKTAHEELNLLLSNP